MKKFDKYVEKYEAISLSKEKKRDDYIKKYLQHVKVRSFRKQMDDDLLWVTFLSDDLSFLLKDSHSCFFITLTLDSKYHHPYLIKRKNVEVFEGSEDERISEGYSILQSCFRFLYKNFRVNRKVVSGVKFCRVIEPHKDFTPHLHALVFIPKGLESNFLHHYNNVINNFMPKGVGKQQKIELLKNTRAGSAYLVKYIKKGLKNRSFDGWKRHHNIRVFTYSRVELPRYLFKLISGRVDHSIKKMKEETYIRALLDACYIKIQDFENFEKINEKIKGNPSANFGVIVSRERVKNTFVSESFSFDDFGQPFYSSSLFLSSPFYRVYNVVIINKKKKEVVFEKSLNLLTFDPVSSSSLFSESKKEVDFFDFMYKF